MHIQSWNNPHTGKLVETPTIFHLSFLVATFDKCHDQKLITNPYWGMDVDGYMYVYVHIKAITVDHSTYHRKKFRSQTSDTMDRWEKRRWEESERRREAVRRSERRKSENKEEAGSQKVGKSRFTVFFQWFVAPEGRKGRLAKALGAEPSGEMRDEKLHAVVARSTFSKSKCTKHTRFGPLLEVAMSKKCTQLRRESHVQVKMYKTHQHRTTFGSCDVEKCTPLWRRSTFPSQNAQNTPGLDHFWKLRCRKSAHRCGANHMSKSKCTKHTNIGPLFGSCDVEKVHAVVVQNTFSSQKCKELRGSDHFLTFRCRKSVRRSGAKHIWKPKVSKTSCFEPFLTFRCRKLN